MNSTPKGVDVKTMDATRQNGFDTATQPHAVSGERKVCLTGPYAFTNVILYELKFLLYCTRAMFS